MKVLVTGGAGFIGSTFVHLLVEKYPEDEVVVLDKLSYGGRMENLQDIKDRIVFIQGDICHGKDIEKAENCEVIFNFAAETHVDRSITEPGAFIHTNFSGTYNLIEYSRQNNVKKYIQISTDEVYGSIPEGSFQETDILDPSSPYSASKGGADLLVRAYYKTYGLPVILSRTSNNFGPYQYPEKLIPVLIINALHDRPLPIYGKGQNVREWIYVKDNCEAIALIYEKGEIGEIYNIGTEARRTNLEIANLVLEELGKPESLITFVPDRLGHDFRYSLNWEKIKRLGWKPQHELTDALKKTIQWYVKNEWWWGPLWK